MPKTFLQTPKNKFLKLQKITKPTLSMATQKPTCKKYQKSSTTKKYKRNARESCQSKLNPDLKSIQHTINKSSPKDWLLRPEPNQPVRNFLLRTMENSSSPFMKRLKVLLRNLSQNNSFSSRNCRTQKIFRKNKSPSIETFISIVKNQPKTLDSAAPKVSMPVLFNLRFTTINPSLFHHTMANKSHCTSKSPCFTNPQFPCLL